jgi:ATP/maltotriose-dependent transcriptional regulator MalT
MTDRARELLKSPINPLTWSLLDLGEASLSRRAGAGVVEGLTNGQIAKRLLVGTESVKSHLSSMYRKLDVCTRAALATAVAEHAKDA